MLEVKIGHLAIPIERHVVIVEQLGVVKGGDLMPVLVFGLRANATLRCFVSIGVTVG